MNMSPDRASLSTQLVRPCRAVLILLLISALPGVAPAQTTLVVESWRDDDRTAWKDSIVPAFEAAHPEIRVEFRASPPTLYDAVLKARLQAGTAGDLIACRPFDGALTLYAAGHLADIGDLRGMDRFSGFARSAWQTDDRAVTFCMPVASVIHGFIYNRDAFRMLGLDEPDTEAAFFAMLERIRADGTWTPLALGLRDRWEAATMGYNNIGPTYWKGEEGRRALVTGEQKLTDEPWVAPFRTLAKWGRYLGKGYETRSYRDSQDLFVRGQAVVYPAGSWSIADFKDRAGFEQGAFPPPVRKAGDACYISDHLDMAIGLNTASPDTQAARVFLRWLATVRFATLHATALPGFFPLSGHPLEIGDPLARTFLSWRGDCYSTIRFAAKWLSRGTPNLEQETWDAAVAAIRGTATAEELGVRLQEGLASWYEPHQ